MGGKHSHSLEEWEGDTHIGHINSGDTMSWEDILVNRQRKSVTHTDNIVTDSLNTDL